MKGLLLITFAAFAAVSQAAQLTLRFNDNSDNELGFEVERRVFESGGDFEPIVLLAGTTESTGIVEFVDMSLEEGVDYEYRLRAYNHHGPSGYTNTANGIAKNPLPDGSQPNDPTIIEIETPLGPYEPPSLPVENGGSVTVNLLVPKS